MAEEQKVLIAIKAPFWNKPEEYAVVTLDPGVSLKDGVYSAIDGLKQTKRDADAASLEKLMSGKYEMRIGGKVVKDTTTVGKVAKKKEGVSLPYAELELDSDNDGGLY
jgi:hypothetical protein